MTVLLACLFAVVIESVGTGNVNNQQCLPFIMTAAENTEVHHANQFCTEAVKATGAGQCHGGDEENKAFSKVCEALKESETFACSEKQLLVNWMDSRLFLARACQDVCKKDVETCVFTEEDIKKGMETYTKKSSWKLANRHKLKAQLTLASHMAKVKDALSEMKEQRESDTKVDEFYNIVQPILSQVFDKVGTPPVATERPEFPKSGLAQDIVVWLTAMRNHNEAEEIEEAHKMKTISDVKKEEQRDDKEGGLRITREQSRTHTEDGARKGPKYLIRDTKDIRAAENGGSTILASLVSPEDPEDQ